MTDKNIFKIIDNFLFPHRCTFCNNMTSKMICPECVTSVKALQFKDDGMIITSTYKSFKNLDYVKAFYNYDEIIRKGILHAKYKESHNFLYSFIEYLPKNFKDFIYNEQIDIIISVPAYKNKFYENEYDLPSEMVKVIANHVKIEYNKNLVKKVVQTKRQHDLAKKDRSVNLRDVFEVSGNVEGKNVLIIDDIITTGHTLDELAGCLKKAGAIKVIGMAFAYRSK